MSRSLIFLHADVSVSWPALGKWTLGLMNVIHSVSGSVLLDYILRSHNHPVVIEGIAVVFRLTINLYSSFWWECWSFSSTVNTYVLGSHADWKTVSRRVIPSCFVHRCVKVDHCSGNECCLFQLVCNLLDNKKDLTINFYSYWWRWWSFLWLCTISSKKT